MTITLNGEPRSHSVDGRLGALLREIGVPVERVAVVVNDEVVSKGALDTVCLHEGDRVEVLTFAAGG